MKNFPDSVLKNGSATAAGRIIAEVVDELCAPESYGSVIHRHHHDIPMPSGEALDRVVKELRAVLFPGYFGQSELTIQTMRYHLGASLDRIAHILVEQIQRGFCFACQPGEEFDCKFCEERTACVTGQFIARIPHIRRLLSTDMQAAYEGDPAAKHLGETVYCYPSILALTNQRIAHEMHQLEIPLIPRIITEMAHSATGIDIHPGAAIGEHFFMDHGTGIVIGETSIIGNHVRLYQGVTLGAKSFPKDEKGNPIKGIPRHPIVEDYVIVYSGATILGRITVGKGSVIGGNVWLTGSVPPGSRIMQSRYQEGMYESGGGI